MPPGTMALRQGCASIHLTEVTVSTLSTGILLLGSAKRLLERLSLSPSIALGEQ